MYGFYLPLHLPAYLPTSGLFIIHRAVQNFKLETSLTD